MTFHIQPLPARKVAGFRLTGPWETTLRQGFTQLKTWVISHNLQGEWIAVYYDNPETVPAEKLRCDTVISVADDFTLPPDSAGVRLMEIAGGDYAVARVRVKSDEFKQAWQHLFHEITTDGGYRLNGQPCFEIYHNDGSESGIWDVDFCIPVERVTECG